MSQKVAVFATCLVDLLKPEIGFAAVTLLESADCEVVVPPQGCCGQPNYNSGDLKGTEQLARQWIATFEPYSAIVVPSGSCAATITKDYIDLFKRTDQPGWTERARSCAKKTWELTTYLRDICDFVPETGSSESVDKISYHDSCSGLRSLGIKSAPRELLATIEGVELVENELAENCCGFGGTFCVKQPEISVALADDKIKSVQATPATTLLGGDWGCLMHLQSRIEKMGHTIQVKHVAEYLADRMTSAEKEGE